MPLRRGRSQSPALREGNLWQSLEICSPSPSPPSAGPTPLLVSLPGASPCSWSFSCPFGIVTPEAALPWVISPICMLQPAPLKLKCRSLFPQGPTLLLWVQSWVGGTPLLPLSHVSSPQAAPSPVCLQQGLRFAFCLHLIFVCICCCHIPGLQPWVQGERASPVWPFVAAMQADVPDVPPLCWMWVLQKQQ